MSLANVELDDIEMVPFTLKYRGVLHSDQAKKADKKAERHAIRLAFHNQLPRLWKLLPMPRRYAADNWAVVPYRGKSFSFADGRIMRLDRDWARIKCGNVDFVPFVIRGAELAMVCELDIRIFWREPRRGGILQPDSQGFDIDSRIKGILDALTVPQQNQLPDDTSGDPNPFLCLLENDNLIMRLLIDAQPLPDPLDENEKDGWIEFQAEVRIHSDELGEVI